jgi:hypothetical protein
MGPYRERERERVKSIERKQNFSEVLMKKKGGI